MLYVRHLRSYIDEWLFVLQMKLGVSSDLFFFFLQLFFVPFFSIIWLSQIMTKHGLRKWFFVIIGLPLLGVFFYLFLVLGSPNQEKWNEIFAYYVNRISVLVRDSSGDVVGKLDNPKLTDKTNSALYPSFLPEFYINILLHREDQYLRFDNNETGIKGLIGNPRSFNGLDAVGMPLAIIKSVLKGHPRGGSSLSQQLVKNYYGMYSFKNVYYRKYKEFTEAKVFYHNLRDNNGSEFKRFVSIATPIVVAQGTQYGLRTGAMIIFGKTLERLEKYEQALLSRMHLNNYYFDKSKRCEEIKNGTLVDLESYFKNWQNKTELKQLKEKVKAWQCPVSPKIPFDFLGGFSELSSKEQIAYGALSSRLQILASSSAGVLKEEINDYREEHPNHLLIESKMTIDIAKNIEFKRGITKRLSQIEKKLSQKLVVDLDGEKQIDEERQANIFISVVDEQGKIVRLYRKGNTSYPRRIGSIGKIFAAIALGLRGDTADTLYWNEPYNGLHNSNGNQGGGLNSKNLYKPRVVFGASKNLPLRSALFKYIDPNKLELISKRVSPVALHEIYDMFGLHRDNRTTIENEVSFGMTNATPLGLQKAIHKLSYILYANEGDQYTEAHILDRLQYKRVQQDKILDPIYMKTNLYVADIAKETDRIFTSKSKQYIQYVLQGSLDKNYGTLRSFRAIRGFTQLFMKSGTTDVIHNNEKLTQSKWVVGTIEVNGRIYSFVIMVEHENGLGVHVKHHELMKPLFHEIVMSLKS